MIIGFIIQILWNQMLDISFLPINSMIAIAIPGVPNIIQAVMIKYIYFDILNTKLGVFKFMNNLGLDLNRVKND